MKKVFEKLKTVRLKAKQTAGILAGIALTMATAVPAFADEAVGSWNGITSEMMSGVLTEIKAILPIVAGTVITFIAFKKGWSFLKRQIKGA